MINQLELSLTITGQAAVRLLDEGTKRRLTGNHLRSKSDAFYLLGTDSENVMIWTGRGQKPRWVTDWLAEGGTLEQLAARLN